MPTLYHHPLSTLSRVARMVVREKHLELDEREEPFWLNRAEYLSVNPSGSVPVYSDEEVNICGGYAVLEYLEETFPELSLIGATPQARAESRRLLDWFELKFGPEVTRFIAYEKLFKRLALNETPDSRAIRAGRENIHSHLEYIAWLTDRRSWLASDSLSIADLAAGAHISLIDYTADVPWDDHPLAKEWFVRLKSRPSFRPLLSDVLPGIPPASIYADLDF